MATDVRVGACALRSGELLDPITPSDRKGILAELNNLLASHQFKGSRRCSEFLQYAVQQVLEGQIHCLKERALGVELFGRAASYDTNSDPVVRATAGEIRKKIAQHYQESAPGAVRILLPVGSYVPVFHIERSAAGFGDAKDPVPTPAATQPASPTTAQHAVSVAVGQRWSARHRWLAIGAGVGLVACFFAVGPGLREISAVRSASHFRQTDPWLAAFWRPFVSAPGDTIVVFSSLGRHSAKPSPDGMAYPNGISTGDIATPGISGVGEVMGVHALDGVFASMHHSLWAKRSDFFSFDDATHENVIFLGSPLANSPLRLLQNNGDFVFQVVKGPLGQPALAIINNRPGPYEPREFFSTVAASPVKQDYAVIALLPGMQSGNQILILAGITTFGTQAAAEFVSRDSSLMGLLHRVKVAGNGQIKPFEAVISVKVDDEVPIEEKIVAVHMS